MARKYPEEAFDDVMRQLKAGCPSIAHDYSLLRKAALRKCAMDVKLDPEELIEDCYQRYVRHLQH